MKKSGSIIILLVLLFAKSDIAAQTTTDLASKNEKLDNFKFLKTDDIFGSRVFIKNNGQFDKNIPNSSKVLYGYESGVDQIYFTATGLTYVLETVKPIDSKVATKSASKSLEENQKVDLEKKYVSVSWENANANIQVVESEKQSHFFSYGDKAMQSNCYKKITYKNVYNHIDIEYLFPNDKKTGVKYNVIVYPGGNPNDIKIKYDGDIEKMNLKDGNITIQTSNGKITETAPLSFQKGETVASTFSLNEKTISFDFASGFDANDTLVIDPFVWYATGDIYEFYSSGEWNDAQFYTGSQFEVASDVDYDNAGNIYIYCQNEFSFYDKVPMIVKYDYLGILQWVFRAVIPAATLGEQVDWEADGGYLANNVNDGCFAVDKISGNIYIGQGNMYPLLNPPVNGARVVRVKTEDASYDDFISIVNPDIKDIHNLIIDCHTSKIYVFSNPSSQVDLVNNGILDIDTKVITSTNLDPDIQHVTISPTMDPEGSIYRLSVNKSTGYLEDGVLSKIKNDFNGTDWKNSTAHSRFHYGGQNILIGPSYGKSTVNCLASNSHYLFYYDRAHLEVYSKVDGSKISSYKINYPVNESDPLYSYSLTKGSGIAVDECNNIYIGTIQLADFDELTQTAVTPTEKLGRILGYSFDGTNIVPNGDITYKMPVPTDPDYPIIPGYDPANFIFMDNEVTDIMYKADTKELYVCGTSFLGICPAFNSTNCDGPDPVSILPVADLKICKGDSLQLKAADGFYNYHWLPNGETTQTIEAKTAGTYTVSATLGCSPSYNSTSQTMTVTLDAPDVNVSASLNSICVGNATTLTATEGLLSYTWSPATGLSTTSGSVVTAHPTVPTKYVVTAFDDKNCQTKDSVTIGIIPKADTVTSTIELKLGETTTLFASTVGSYVWSPSSGLSCATCQTTTVLPLNSLNYCVEITDENKCASTECFDIKLNTSCGELFVPNAFSPNNDGNNDLLKVEINPYCLTEYNLQIFDRWGEKIFESTKVSESWDGKYNGKELDNAVFVYYLKVMLKDSTEPIVKKGNVSIIK